MKQLLIIFIASVVVGFSANQLLTAQEKVVLTAPVQAVVGSTDFRVQSLELYRSHPDGGSPSTVPNGGAAIRVVFREVDAGNAFVAQGKRLHCNYNGDIAEQLLIALNKVNLSTTSLEKRVTQRCQTDGQLGAGTMSGTPQ